MDQKNAVFWDVTACGWCSSETSVFTRATLRHVPEGGILHGHRRENLQFYTVVV
jgi:hypothetical protein